MNPKKELLMEPMGTSYIRGFPKIGDPTILP